MKKQLLILLIACMLVLTSCIPSQYSTGGQEVIVVTATPIPEQQVIYVTATPDGASPIAAATTSPASIKIIGVVDDGGGKATIYWETSGDFPVGFELVWSDSDDSPTFPENPSMYIGDPNKRSAQIQGDVNKTYYVRICRYVNNSCDVYSDLGTIKFTKPTANPTNTAIPTIAYPTATVYSGPPFIKITGIQYTASQSARIYWQAYGSFPKGFLILYVQSKSTVPTYGDYKYYQASSTTRSYDVYGTNGEYYTFVVCRWTGTSCDMNSNPYVFRFSQTTPTKTPSGIYPLP
jgi:hypothetical protein